MTVTEKSVKFYIIAVFLHLFISSSIFLDSTSGHLCTVMTAVSTSSSDVWINVN